MNSHVLAHVGRSVWDPKWTSTRNRIPAEDAKHHEFPRFGDDNTLCSCALVCFPCLFSSKHNEFTVFWPCWRIPVPLRGPFRTPHLATNMRQHAQNLKVPRHVVDVMCFIFGSTHCVATMQNSMNSHVLAHVGRSIWDPKCTPNRHRIPAEGAKQHEFPRFGDDRTLCSCALVVLATHPHDLPTLSPLDGHVGRPCWRKMDQNH